MNAQQRRTAILETLHGSELPVSATSLASNFGVSRQIIVSDVAILRAAGENISATPRGYVIEKSSGLLVRTVACCHSAEDMEKELNLIVDNGCTVRDVIVEHPVYGQISGALDLRSRYDVSRFAERSKWQAAAPLSALTEGVHLHSLLCPDEEAFERVKAGLDECGILLR